MWDVTSIFPFNRICSFWTASRSLFQRDAVLPDEESQWTGVHFPSDGNGRGRRRDAPHLDAQKFHNGHYTAWSFILVGSSRWRPVPGVAHQRHLARIPAGVRRLVPTAQEQTLSTGTQRPASPLLTVSYSGRKITVHGQFNSIITAIPYFSMTHLRVPHTSGLYLWELPTKSRRYFMHN
jgi:hypothetical protein